MYNPQGLALDQFGNLYLADTQDSIVRFVNRSTGSIKTIAGMGSGGFSGDHGKAIYAQLHNPYGLVVDTSGGLYIADTSNHRIRFVNSTGYITTFAGGGMDSDGDHGPAIDAALETPIAVALDHNNNLLIADAGTTKNNVRIVSPNGIVTTFAGSSKGGQGYSGDGGQAHHANLTYPTGIAVGPNGNVYIADGWNYVIRMVTPSGIISTFAGTYNTLNDDANSGRVFYGGDGGLATNAYLNIHPHGALLGYPSLSGVAVDQQNNVYISDIYNNRVRVVSSPSGIITTLAGNGQRVACGGCYSAGVTYQCCNTCAEVQSAYNLKSWFFDASLIAQCAPGFNLDAPFGVGVLPTNTALTFPTGLAIDAYNNVFIATGISMDESQNGYYAGDPGNLIRMVGKVYTCPPGTSVTPTGCVPCPPGTLQGNYLNSTYVIQRGVCQSTMQPSTQPSEQPTNYPTSQPSERPSSQPTNLPIEKPTSQPTQQPSGEPSVYVWQPRQTVSLLYCLLLPYLLLRICDETCV